MNKDELINLILDNLSAVNYERTKENLSRERLIFNSGQRDALTNLLKQLQKW